MRRFWQSSTDHRGTPERPGRVATLIPYEDILENSEFIEDLAVYDATHDIQGPESLITLGVVYYIPPEYAKKVRAYLDVREQGGYSLHEVNVHLETSPKQEEELSHLLQELPTYKDTGRRMLRTSVYIGTIQNESFIGPEDILETAKTISQSKGPSGSNHTYLKLLHSSLEEMPITHNSIPVHDLYLDKLLCQVESLMNKKAL